MRTPNFIKGGIVPLSVVILAITIVAVFVHSGGRAPDPVPDTSKAPRLNESQVTAGENASSDGVDEHPPSLPSKSADRSANEKARREHDVALLEEQMKELEKRENDDRRSYAADLQFPNNPVKPLYENLTHQKEAMVEMKAGGIGSQHPQMVVQQRIVEAVTGDVDQAVARLSAQMKTEWDVQRQTLRGQR